jgi:hypothetical protein
LDIREGERERERERERETEREYQEAGEICIMRRFITLFSPSYITEVII